MNYIINHNAILFLPIILNILMLIGVSSLKILSEMGRKTSLLLVSMVFFNIIFIAFYHFHTGKISANLLQMAPGLSLSFVSEDKGVIFALLASFLWLITHIYSEVYLGVARAKKLSFYFAIAMGSVLCASFAANLITLFIFYEILTLATYPMIKFDDSAEAEKSAKKYLIMLLGSSFLCFFPAMAINYHYVGNLDFQINKGIILSDNIALLLIVLYVFGLAKTAIMPIHSWLTAAMTAPVPVSALLHAVAVVKVGIFTFLRIINFNIGLHNLTHYGALFLAIIASVTIIAGAIIAKRQQNFKLMLAYSTISQLSYSILICAMATTEATGVAFVQMISHALAKIVLFFAAGYFYLATHVTNIKDLGNIGKQMPIITICFSICSLSIIGIPPLVGFWGKFYMLKASYPLNDISCIIIATIIVATYLTAAYFMPIIYQFWWGQPLQIVNKNYNIFPIVMVTLGVILLGFSFNFIKNTIS